MSDTTGKFSKEEQDHLSYLGSMLRGSNDEEEQLIEEILEAGRRLFPLLPAPAVAFD